MAFELLIAVVSVIVGFLIAYWLISKIKWGDKKDAIDAGWHKKFSEYRRKVEVNVEKIKTYVEVSKGKRRMSYLFRGKKGIFPSLRPFFKPCLTIEVMLSSL